MSEDEEAEEGDGSRKPENKNEWDGSRAFDMLCLVF